MYLLLVDISTLGVMIRLMHACQPHIMYMVAHGFFYLFAAVNIIDVYTSTFNSMRG